MLLIVNINKYFYINLHDKLSFYCYIWITKLKETSGKRLKRKATLNSPKGTPEVLIKFYLSI